jgi:hypothetical protein
MAAKLTTRPPSAAITNLLRPKQNRTASKSLNWFLSEELQMPRYLVGEDCYPILLRFRRAIRSNKASN